MALTNAERQARYRDRHRVVTPGRPAPLRSVPPPSKSRVKPFTVKHFRQWARRLELDNGNQMDTEPFQEAFAEDLFSGVPECWLIIPEGNAKTTLFAALALYHIEHRRSGMVPVAASSRDQAQIMYQQAEGFILRSELPHFKLHPGYRRVAYPPMLSMVQFQAADDRTGDGVIPTMALLDELHRHRDLRLYRTWRGKLLKRNGQIGAISTRGEPGSEFEETIGTILETATEVSTDGAFTRVATPRFILHQWAVPTDGDVEDMALVKAANPLKAITVEALTEKRQAPTMTLPHWLRFVCNRPTRDVECWLGPDAERIWSDLEDPYDFVKGAPTYAGVDVAIKHDTSAVVAIQKRPDGKWHAKCRIWTPTEDRPVDVTDVMQHLRDLDHDYKLVSTAYDPRFFDVAAKMLTDEGLTLSEVPQESGRMTAAVGYLYAAIMEGKVAHDDDVEYGRQVLNAVPRYSERGFVLAKSKSHGKIDAAIATSLAYDQVLRFEEDEVSVYEERELIAV